jgi:hypothetical protein
MTKGIFILAFCPYFNGAKSESEVRRNNEGMNLLVLNRQVDVGLTARKFILIGTRIMN